MNSKSHYGKESREEATRLLNEGKSVPQIAKLLQIPTPILYYWRRTSRKLSQPNTDGRRLYNETLKQEVFRQLDSGVSVREVSTSFGITRVTVYKWRKERPNEIDRHPAIQNTLLSEDTSKAQASEQETDESSSIGKTNYLLEQIRQLTLERDALKMALEIVLRRAE